MFLTYIKTYFSVNKFSCLLSINHIRSSILSSDLQNIFLGFLQMSTGNTLFPCFCAKKRVFCNMKPLPSLSLEDVFFLACRKGFHASSLLWREMEVLQRNLLLSGRTALEISNSCNSFPFFRFPKQFTADMSSH